MGLILSAGIFVVIAIMDDTIKTEEDIEKYLGRLRLLVYRIEKITLIKNVMEKRKKEKNKKGRR